MAAADGRRKSTRRSASAPAARWPALEVAASARRTLNSRMKEPTRATSSSVDMTTQSCARRRGRFGARRFIKRARGKMEPDMRAAELQSFPTAALSQRVARGRAGMRCSRTGAAAAARLL